MRIHSLATRAYRHLNTQSLIRVNNFNINLNSKRVIIANTRDMSASIHPVASSADPATGDQPAHPLPDVTAPHDTAPPPKVDAPAPSGAAKKEGKPQKQGGGGAPQQGKSKDKKDKKGGGGGSSGPLELSPPPEYFEERIKIFDEYMEKYKKHVAGELRHYHSPTFVVDLEENR